MEENSIWRNLYEFAVAVLTLLKRQLGSFFFGNILQNDRYTFSPVIKNGRGDLTKQDDIF